MDAREALLRMAKRVDHARAEAVHGWTVSKLSEFGTEGLASDSPDVIRLSGDGWGHGLALLGDAIEAIHGHDDGRVAKILSLPAQWLVLSLWVLLDQTKGTPPKWLREWHPTDDPGVMTRRVDDVIALLSTVALADRLFREGSVSHQILADVFRDEGNQQSALWSLVHVSTLTGSILYIQEHGAPADWPKALLVTGALAADLSPEIIGEA